MLWLVCPRKWHFGIFKVARRPIVIFWSFDQEDDKMRTQTNCSECDGVAVGTMRSVELHDSRSQHPYCLECLQAEIERAYSVHLIYESKDKINMSIEFYPA